MKGNLNSQRSAYKFYRTVYTWCKPTLRLFNCLSTIFHFGYIIQNLVDCTPILIGLQSILCFKENKSVLMEVEGKKDP